MSTAEPSDYVRGTPRHRGAQFEQPKNHKSESSIGITLSITNGRIEFDGRGLIAVPAGDSYCTAFGR